MNMPPLQIPPKPMAGVIHKLTGNSSSRCQPGPETGFGCRSYMNCLCHSDCHDYHRLEVRFAETRKICILTNFWCFLVTCFERILIPIIYANLMN